MRPGADGGAAGHEPALARFVRRLRWTSVLVTAPVVFFFATDGTWNPRLEYTIIGGSRFFQRQAEALLRGHLYVASSDLPGECLRRAGKCYGYFGLTPSLLRIPLLPVLHAVDSSLSPVYVTVAVLVAYLAAIDLVFQVLKRHPLHTETGKDWPSRVFAVLACLSLGLGGIPLTLARVAVYNEAIVWCMALLMVTINLLWRWAMFRDHRLLVLAAVTGTLASNARPSAAIPCVIFGVGVVIAAYARPQMTSRRMVVVAGVALALTPILTTTTVFWLKLRTVAPDLLMHEGLPETPPWNDIFRRNHNATQGLQFVPTALVIYLRPDSFKFDSVAPWVDFRVPKYQAPDFIAPLPNGGAYVEPVASITADMPLPTLLTMLSFAGILRRRHRQRPPPGDDSAHRFLWLFLLVGASAGCALALVIVTITYRYLGDFYPALATGFAAAPLFALPLLRRSRTAVTISLLVAGSAVAWSLLVHLGLAWRHAFL